MACLVFSLNEMPCGVYILMTRVASTNIIHGRNRKNMRRTLIVSWAVAVALCASAQKPQEIKGIVEEAHDSLWYAGQVEAWQREVDADGQDEKAWRNLFEAAWGLKSCSRGKNDGGMTRILERMERAIPETYTYNICAYRASQGPDNKFAEKAMTLLPDDISDRGYDAVLGYLWMMGETDGTGWKAGLFNDILRRQYEHGKYPSFILRFGYNQLQGMAEGGLFFGNGDAELFDKLMLQRAMRVHTDKVVVVIPFLSMRSYRDALCRQLGIPPFPGREVRTEEEFKAAVQEMVEYVIRESGRPAYFSPGSQWAVQGIARKLYNEGLVYRYSEEPYDNVSAAQRHVERDYHFDYLTEPAFRVETWWSGSEMLLLNYTVMLGPLVQSYRESGNRERADWLYRILKASVENGGFSAAKKKGVFGLFGEMAVKINFRPSLRKLSDEELMGRVRRTGDEKAFDELYRRYARRLHGFFFRMLGREEQLAADFTQELFLRVWAARGRYECGRELCPWFFTMAYNLCRNEYRFRNIAVGFAEEVRGGPDTYEEQPELRMDIRMFDRELSALLDKLPPEQRVLFALRYEEELTVPQLAEVMGIPEGTVKSRLHYLLQYLRKKLKVYETL